MSYKEGIVKAIEELKDRNGSSMISIKKHMQADMPKDKKWLNGFFLTAIKSSVTAGDFLKVKNSLKLSAEFKKKRSDAMEPKKKAVVAKKKTVLEKKKVAPKKKVGTKKTGVKKTTMKKKASVKKTVKKTVTKKKTSTKKTVKKTVKKAVTKKQ